MWSELSTMSSKREYGDYQTPLAFAAKVCDYLKNERNLAPSAIIEPTCGIGNFVKSSLIFDAKEILGIEINPEYCQRCTEQIDDSRVRIINANFFSFDSKALIQDDSQILIIGNPPWVNNSTLSVLDSDNLPAKKNFKGLKGIEAITGSSNFDICEHFIMQLVDEYAGHNVTIAMLCKTSVARNVFIEMSRKGTPFSTCDMLEFDAQKVFGINASACLLLIQLSSQGASTETCRVYSLDNTSELRSSFGYRNGQLYSDVESQTDNFNGKSCFEWRQGVKHDCSKVMELMIANGHFYNGNNERVDIENDMVFPLVKSSMFKTPIIHGFSKYVIVTQKKARDETAYLQTVAPKTWDYLMSNMASFQKRKSSIYRGAPPFSMFGVGDYSYSRYKVGVSGFYKQPLFSVLFSENGKPVMTDDTGYFICFESYTSAYVAMILLNSKRVQRFLLSIAFLDAKRPFTKKMLERIDFSKIIAAISFAELVETEKGLGLNNYVTESMFAEFCNLPAFLQTTMPI